MPRSILAQLVVALRDDTSRNAKAIAGSLDGITNSANRLAGIRKLGDLDKSLRSDRASTQEMAAALSGGIGWGDKFSRELLKLRIAPREFARVRDSWSELQRALANPAGGRTAFNVLGAQGEWRKRQLTEIIAVRSEMARLREEAARPISIARKGLRMGAAAVGVYSGIHGAGRVARGTAIAGASDQRETFRQGLAGLNAEEIAKISASSETLAGKYPSVSRVDIRELARGARNLTGDVGKGLALLPDIVRARVAIQSATGGGGDGELEQLLKSADIAGLQDDPARFKSFLESFAKATQVEGKQISAGDYLSFYRRAKMAGSGFSDAFIGAAAPSLIQELGGPTAGTALATFFQQMAGGRAKKETLANQQKAGLRGKDGVLVDRQAFISDPFEWTQQYIAPLMKKSGVDMSSSESMIDFLIPLFSERNAAEVASKFIIQADQIRRNQKMYGGAKGLAAAEDARKEDPFVAASGALNSLANAAAALASPAVPAATSVLNTFTDSMNSLAGALRDNPELAKKASTVATGAVAGAGIVGSIRAAAALWRGGGVAGAIGGGLRGAFRGGLLGGALGGIGGYLLTPLMALRDAGEIKRPVTPTRHRMDQEIPPDAWERSRRVKAEFGQDKESFYGRAFMRGADPAPEGQAAGQQFTSVAASAIAAGAPAVLSAGKSVLDQLKAVLSSGAEIPVRLTGRDIVDNLKAGRAPGDLGPTDPAAPARASGGSVAAGGLYRVNEFGEEFFQPTEDGRIIDPRRMAAGPGASKAASISVNAPITITGVQDSEAVIEQVFSEFEKRVQAAVQGAFADVGVELA